MYSSIVLSRTVCDFLSDAYSRLILEALRGDQQHFLRRDELRAAWAIFDNLLQQIDNGEVPVHEYERGTRGPPQADELLASLGYRRPTAYQWVKKAIHAESGGAFNRN